MKKYWTENSHLILNRADGLENYNRWIISHFAKYFGRAILEIGSGQGALSKLLPSKSIVILSDIFPQYVNYLKKIFTDPVFKIDIEKEAPESLAGKMDTIFSSNVFEHIADDLAAFKNSHYLLEANGRLLLFVPARPEIYGKIDDEMGHYRRYTKLELRQKAETAGFVVKEIYYANLLGYFLWWGRGRFRVSQGDTFFAKVFDTLVVPFLYLEKYIHPPFGQSLVMIAEKPSK